MAHQGAINGFTTSLIRIPKNKQLVVLLHNGGGTNLGVIQDHILKILYDQPVELPKISMAHVLGTTLVTSSLENALRQFAEIKKQPAYYHNEGEINGLGYGMISMGRTREAIAVFNLNVLEYPQSFNVWDSRGEAYMLNGDTAKAIMDYKKSLELDPYSMNAIKKLNDLGEKVPDPKEAPVEGKMLDTYVGQYELHPSFVISITMEAGRLYSQAPGKPRVALFAESTTKFFMKAIDGKILFIKNEQGNVEKLILFQDGREMTGKRIE